MQEVQNDILGGETGTCLNEETKKENLRVIDVTGGHGPWQLRHWGIFFLASLCTSLQLFSTLPLVSHSPCTCAYVLENNGSSQPSKCNISRCVTRRNEMSWSELSDPCFSPLPTSVLEFIEEDSSHCSNLGVVTYSKCLFVFGCLISTFSTYPLLQRYGRRSVSLTACFLLSACSLAGIWAFAPGPYLVLKFVLSMGIVTVYIITAISLTDCLTEEFRLLYFYTAHISWGLAHFILPLLIWIIPRWTIYNVILSIPCFLLLVILSFLSETAESYASRGLMARAHKVMQKAAMCNGYSLQGVEQFSPNLLLQVKDDGDLNLTLKIENYRNTIEHAAFILMGFFSSFIYFTSMWLTDWLQEKRAPYFSLYGTAEVASVLVFLFFVHFIPVRRLWGLTSCLSSVLLIVLYFKVKKDLPSFPRSSSVPHIFFASAAFTVLLLHVLSSPLNSKRAKSKALSIGFGLCLGLLGAASADLQKLIGWNRIIFLIMSVPNLLLGAFIGLIPNKYLECLNF